MPNNLMSDSTIEEPIVDMIKSSAVPTVLLDGACWLVWPSERTSGVRAAMSKAQFVHFNAPVVAIQTSGRMEYLNKDGEVGWTSNLPWPRANLEMARLPSRAENPATISPKQASKNAGER